MEKFFYQTKTSINSLKNKELEVFLPKQPKFLKTIDLMLNSR